MQRYPPWKYALIVLVLAAGALYALPNVYGTAPALQISAQRGSPPADEALLKRVTRELRDAELVPALRRLEEQRLLLSFQSGEDRRRARELLGESLGEGYVVALHLADRTPDWLRGLSAEPMNLGLDLRGGVHFLMEVDVDAAVQRFLEGYRGQIRELLRAEGIYYRELRTHADGFVRLELVEEVDVERALALIESASGVPSELELRTDEATPLVFDVFITAQRAADLRDQILGQNVLTLRNRVNALGVAEPIVQRQGEQRIAVQLPGVQDTARAKLVLGAAATLEFRMVDEEGDAEAAAREGRRAPSGSRLYQRPGGAPVLLKRDIITTGEHVASASAGLAQDDGSPAVFIRLDGTGGGAMRRTTREAVGKLMAVVYKETKTEIVERNGEQVLRSREIEEVISVATVRSVLGRDFMISGLDSIGESHNLALLLSAGSLAAPFTIVEERTVGPSLGRENIERGLNSIQLGLGLVLIFMVLYYSVFGLIANLALMLNLVLLAALLSLLQATLTLPGIAGVVLTVGMAVDANVLIFERIREELRNANTPLASIQAGYEKAFSTIADANITTLIAAVILFAIGSGPVRGFAVTLSLGILCSMFTAIMGTRALMQLLYGRARALRRLPIGAMQLLRRRARALNFMGHRRFGAVLSGVLLSIAVASLLTRGLNFGIDFTGGTLVEVEYETPVDIGAARELLAGTEFEDIVLQAVGEEQKQLLMRLQAEAEDGAARSERLLELLRGGGGAPRLKRVDFVGPQVGKELAELGSLALLMALLCILIYVALRFELRFAVGAIAALLHDVLLTAGFFSVFGFVFDLSVLAALLAVIGYSLNDTIVVFDRIRDNFRRLHQKTPVEVCNVSLNQTLNRTLVTTLTTLLVLASLFLFGGEIIRPFTVALAVGVLVGTYSSLFVASPVALGLGVSHRDLQLRTRDAKDSGAVV